MKTCTKCGETKPFEAFYKHRECKDGLRPSCIECAAANYQLNKDRTLPRLRITNAAWKHRNKKKIKKYHANRYRENKQEITAKVLKWRRANKDRFVATNAKWKRDNPGKITAYNHRRRAAKTSAGGVHTAAEIAALLVTQSHLCANPTCRVDLRVVHKHLDHRMPLVRGGSNGVENLQWLCQPCNLRKGTLTPDKWLMKEAA